MRWWTGIGGVVLASLACGGGETASEEGEGTTAPEDAAPEPAPAEGGEAGEDDEDDDEGGGGGRRKSKLPPLGEDKPNGSDCTLVIADIEADLDKDQPGARPTRFKHGLGRTVEKVRYQDGRELRITSSGCNHIDVLWQFAPVPEEDPVALAKKHFDVKMKSPERKPLPLSCIDAATGDGASYPCGEGTATLKREGEILSFEYNFAL